MILGEINLSYRDSKIRLPEKVQSILSSNSKLNDFLWGTPLITTKYPRAFLYLKLSEEERKLPESEDIRVALLDGKQSFIEVKFKTIKDSKDLVDAYEKIVLDLLEKNFDRPARLFNILNVSIKNSRKNAISFNQNVYDKAIGIVNSKLKEYFHRFDLEDIFLALEQCSSTLRSPIIDHCTRLLAMTKGPVTDESFGTLDLNKYQRSLMHQIATHITWFSDKKTEIQKIIATSYSSNLDIIEYFCSDNNLINFFLSEQALNKIVEQISESDVQEVKEDENIKLLQKVEILKKCIDIMNNQAANLLIKKLTLILKSINTKPFGKSKRQFLAVISDVDVLVSFRFSDINKVEINNFSEELYNGSNVAGSEQLKAEYVIPMILIVDKTDGSVKSNIDSFINSFFKQCKTKFNY
ncbi:hypothetical protein ES705_42292 [subsurface metagenome]